MTNSADPDQLASSEANWSGSTLFAKTGHVVFSKRRVNKMLNICIYLGTNKMSLFFFSLTKIYLYPNIQYVMASSPFSKIMLPSEF